MLCMLLGVGNMWAAEEVYKTALFGESYNSKAVSSYDNSWSATNEDFTVNLTNFNNNNNGWSYVKCGRKNYESTGTITTASAIDKAVTKVVVTVDAFTSGKVNSFKLYVASNAEFSTDIQTISHSIATGANTFTVTAPTENQFYKIEIDCASGSNGLVQISKIEYYYDNSPVGDDRDPAGLSYSTDVFSATIGETNTFPTLNNPNTLTVTYESSDESIATINSNGAITLLAAGETVISASFAGNDSYKEGSASYTLTVIDPNAPGMSAENPYTITQAKAAIDAGTGVTGVYVAGIISQIDSYNTTYHSITYWISTDGQTADFEVYSGRGLNNADFAAVTDLKVGDQVVIYGNIKKYNSTYEFDKENYIVSLVREEKQEPELAFNPTSVEINVGDTFTAPTLSNPHNVAVTYESSNTNVATVSANGAVTLAGSTGTTTITASFAGDDSFFAGEAFYTLTVVDPNAPGASADNPYTVAQARAAIDAGTGVTGVYATGIVSKIVTAYNATYGNITYNISADGSEEGDQLQAYRGFDKDGAWFTSADDIQVGDEVVIYGNLKKHNSTYEFDAGNQLVSLNRPVNTDPVINAEDVTLAYDATSGEIAYTISNVDEGTELDGATPNADWISGITIASDKVTFTTTANEGTEDRTATVTLSYGDVTKDVTVTQGHYVAPVIDYATLPFEFDGGRADIETTDGMTQEGLDSDYGSSPKLKFNSTNDVVILHFNEQPGTLTFDIKGNSFSGSTFKVQTSADGVNYTDLKSYTTLGNTQSEIIEDIDAAVRYIKWIYTEKVSGNVALGNITLAKYTNKQDATVSFKKDGEAITTLEANLNAEIEVAVECSVEGAELNITSSNSRVAKYEDGVVKALAEGEATITATFAGNENYKAATATLVVTVVDNRQEVTLSFNDVPAEINVNETATYTVTATPAVEGVTYSSSAPTVVSVDENTGAIEALAIGTATISATFAGDANYKAATATYTIKVVNPSFVGSKYELVADATTLKAGDEIIIVGVDGDNAYALSISQNNNNRAATSVTIASDATISSTAEVAVITLGGEADAWTFYVTNGADQGYLYAASSSANHLKTEAEADDNAKATITIENGVSTIDFTGTNTRNRMRYNPNSGSPIFSCYASTSTAGSLVSIYRKVTSSEEPLKGDVNKDGYQTIADVTALVNIILGKATPDTNPDYDFDAADVNGDGGVPTIADVTALVNIILGKE